MSKDMREHLGISDTVEVQFRRNTIVLKNPDAPDEDETPKAKADKAGKGGKGKKGK